MNGTNSFGILDEGMGGGACWLRDIGRGSAGIANREQITEVHANLCPATRKPRAAGALWDDLGCSLRKPTPNWDEPGEGVGLLVVVFVFQAAAGQKIAQGFFPGRTALFSGDIAVAVNHYVDRVHLGFKHGRQVGVVR